jgi:hypothetical protein
MSIIEEKRADILTGKQVSLEVWSFLLHTPKTFVRKVIFMMYPAHAGLV